MRMARQQWGGQNEAAYQLATLIARASRTKSIELSIARNRASLVTLARRVWWYLVIAALLWHAKRPPPSVATDVR
jgi:hypothetical protein